MKEITTHCNCHHCHHVMFWPLSTLFKLWPFLRFETKKKKKTFLNLSGSRTLHILHFTLMHQHWIAAGGTICNSKYIVLSIQDLGNGISAFYGYFMLCINHSKNFTPACSTSRHFMIWSLFSSGHITHLDNLRNIFTWYLGQCNWLEVCIWLSMSMSNKSLQDC